MNFITQMRDQPRQIQLLCLTNIMHAEHSEVSCGSHSAQKFAQLCPQESCYCNVDLDAKRELCFSAQSLGKGPFRALRHRTEKLGIQLHCITTDLHWVQHGFWFLCSCFLIRKPDPQDDYLSVPQFSLV